MLMHLPMTFPEDGLGPKLWFKRKFCLKESCAVEGRVQRAMVKIVRETLQWSRHVLFKCLSVRKNTGVNGFHGLPPFTV